jgi:UPF0755 protein
LFYCTEVLISFLFLQKKRMAEESKTHTMKFQRIGKLLIILLGVLLIALMVWAYQLYGYIFNPNVVKDAVILVPKGSTYNDVEKLLQDQQVIKNYRAFRWVAKKKKYRENVKPGRYELKKDWNSNTLLNKLRNGVQDPVNVTFNNVRTFPELAGKIAGYLECDSTALLAEFTNKDIPAKDSFTEGTFPAMFIPNTYEFFWTSTPSQFVDRMKKEYDHFWTPERTERAKALGLSPIEVSILASIVQEETNKDDEKPVIAGVYLNRLKRGMLLQACPTVKYTVGDFTLRRITTAMTQIASPYNTYLNAGLPPGPITIPEISSINAVLNAKQHDYLYFCANPDFSGYNVFSRTLAEHNRNAALYQSALNQKKIWK